MKCLKSLSYISAAVHLLLMIVGSISCILVCAWYNDPHKMREDASARDMPLWLWILLTIYFLIGVVTSGCLIRGILKENFKLFHSFFSNMFIIIVFITIRAIITMVHQIRNHYSGSDVAVQFFIDIAYCVFSAIVMIPCFVLYKKWAGQSFFVHYFGSCCGEKHQPTLVPSHAV